MAVVGPFLACGVYAAARDLERGIEPSVSGGLRLLSQRKASLALLSLAVRLIMAAWVRLSALLFALRFNTFEVPAEVYLTAFTSISGFLSLWCFVAIGLLLAVVLFTISAVAIPLILDRDTNFVAAIGASLQAVTKNFPAMLVWASLIFASTALGIAAAVGLAFVFPALGYATWHSYRALVRHHGR